MGRMIAFACPGGSEARGYLSESPGARAGVVVIQEWWGLNQQIKGVVEHFAVDAVEAEELHAAGWIDGVHLE